jgi:hypothetical protein
MIIYVYMDVDSTFGVVLQMWGHEVEMIGEPACQGLVRPPLAELWVG